MFLDLGEHFPLSELLGDFLLVPPILGVQLELVGAWRGILRFVKWISTAFILLLDFFELMLKCTLILHF